LDAGHGACFDGRQSDDAVQFCREFRGLSSRQQGIQIRFGRLSEREGVEKVQSQNGINQQPKYLGGINIIINFAVIII
jgi:hypothetical protein